MLQQSLLFPVSGCIGSSCSLLGHQLPSPWLRWSTLPCNGAQIVAQVTEGPKVTTVFVCCIETGLFNNAKPSGVLCRYTQYLEEPFCCNSYFHMKNINK